METKNKCHFCCVQGSSSLLRITKLSTSSKIGNRKNRYRFQRIQSITFSLVCRIVAWSRLTEYSNSKHPIFFPSILIEHTWNVFPFFIYCRRFVKVYFNGLHHSTLSLFIYIYVYIFYTFAFIGDDKTMSNWIRHNVFEECHLNISIICMFIYVCVKVNVQYLKSNISYIPWSK